MSKTITAYKVNPQGFYCGVVEISAFDGIGPECKFTPPPSLDKNYRWDCGSWVACSNVDVSIQDSVEYSTPYLAETVRKKRDTLLSETVDAMNPIRWEQLTNDQKEAWRYYRQALLDIPEQLNFPFLVDWPEIPKSTISMQQDPETTTEVL